MQTCNRQLRRAGRLTQNRRSLCVYRLYTSDYRPKRSVTIEELDQYFQQIIRFHDPNFARRTENYKQLTADSDAFELGPRGIQVALRRKSRVGEYDLRD